MKVALIVEGAYPYVNGGMSNWVQQLMQNMPDTEFIVQCISADRKIKREFKYQIPENCSEIQEVYLMDDDYISDKKQRTLRLNARQYEAFESLLFGEHADWDTLIDFFENHDVSLNALLSGKDFLSMTLNYYESHYDRIVFTDFLWTMRSMYLPLFTIMKSRVCEVDLYHSASCGYAGIWATMQKSMFNKPFIMSEHGIYTREREEEIIKANWVSGIYKDLWISQFHKIGDCCYRYADVVTSLYNDAKKFQIELGCKEEKTITIPNGINPERFAHIPGKDPDDDYINVGALIRVTPIKDVKTMINAFGIAKANNPKLKLWIMGDLEEAKEYAQECMALVNDLNIPDVVFTGVINPNDYIGKMDMLLLSSLSEGQPLSILEAYTAKKPFIASNVGNCSGLINGEFDDYGPAGMIVPIMNGKKLSAAILELAENEEKRRQMGEIGNRRTKEFYSEKDCFDKYTKLYEETVRKGAQKWPE